MTRYYSHLSTTLQAKTQSGETKEGKNREKKERTEQKKEKRKGVPYTCPKAYAHA